MAEFVCRVGAWLMIARLEPCVEPENENTNMPILLSPALSKASSGYFPQSSFTSTHSYYSTAEDNNIEEEKTSGGKK